MPSITVTGRQLSAARALLGIRQGDVAGHTACTRASVSMVERGQELPVKDRIVTFLAARGIEFIRGGVRLKRRP